MHDFDCVLVTIRSPCYPHLRDCPLPNLGKQFVLAPASPCEEPFRQDENTRSLLRERGTDLSLGDGCTITKDSVPSWGIWGQERVKDILHAIRSKGADLPTSFGQNLLLRNRVTHASLAEALEEQFLLRTKLLRHSRPTQAADPTPAIPAPVSQRSIETNLLSSQLLSLLCRNQRFRPREARGQFPAPRHKPQSPASTASFQLNFQVLCEAICVPEP